MSVVAVPAVLKNASPQVIFEYLEVALQEEEYESVKSEMISILNERQKKPEKEVINSLANIINQHAHVVSFFDKIYNLANAKHFHETENILIGLCVKDDILESLNKENAYDKMIQLAIKDKELFFEVYYVLSSKEYNESSWIERNDFEIPNPFNEEIIGERIGVLKNEIKDASKKEGRKGICNDNYFKYQGEFWIIFDVEDSIFTDEILDKKKEVFTPQSFIPKKSIIFILNPVTHSLKMHAKGGDKKNKEFTESFCKTILDTTIADHPPKNSSYNIQEIYLRVLKEKILNLRMTESEITKIFINKVRLGTFGGKFIRTPELANKKGFNDCIYEEFEAIGLTRKIQPTERLEGENWSVEQIHLTALYRDDFSSKQQRKNFSITSVGKVNLNYAGIGNKIRNVLKENGL